MRILEFFISEEEAGCSVEAFLKKRLKFEKRQISRLKFRQGGMVLNGKQCRSKQKLQAGDCLQIRLDEEGKLRRSREVYSGTAAPEQAFPVHGEDESIAPEQVLKVLYEDEDVLAVYKPGGIAVHPSHGHGRDTLWNQVISYQNERGECWTPRLIGRLDKDTSGIILLAKTTEAAAALAVQREKKELKKIYYAEAEGLFSESEGWIDRPMEKDPAYLNRMRISQTGMPARTHYQLLQIKEEGDEEVSFLQLKSEGGRPQRISSILELELEQGRTHQIRLHLSSIGHPLVGDPIYNPTCKTSLLHLHAGKMQWNSPFTGETITITAPLPEWLKGGIEV